MASNVTGIAVDTDALRALASRCLTAQDALADDAGVFGGDGSGIEHPRLRSTLDHFDERWSDKRHTIVDSLGKVSQTMVSVADSFADVDDQLAACVLGEGGASS